MDSIFDALVLVRWVHFGAMFVLFGCATFPVCVPPGHGGGVVTPRVGRLCCRWAAPLALVSGLGWLVGTLVSVTGGIAGLGDPETLHAFFFETMFGPIEIARLVGLVVLLALVFAPMPDRRRHVFVALGSGALLVSQGWLGHAAEGGDSWRGAAMIACYGVHVLAAGAWVGSLLLLLTRVHEMRSAPTMCLSLLSRYSLLASLAVALVVASGVANALFRVGTRADALLSSSYGAVLGVKVGLVTVMLALAAFNRFVAMPRLGSQAPARLGTSIVCEIVLGSLVLAAAAVLGITPPPAV